MQKKILSFGEIVWDIFENKKILGGAPFNFARFSRKFGADAYILSAVGKDENGAEVFNFMAHEGMPSDFVQELEGEETGKVLVKIENNAPSYEICSPAAWDKIEITPQAVEFAARSNAIAFGTLAQRSDVSRQNLFKIIRSSSKKCLKVFDANLRQNFYSKEIITSSLEIANILKINEEELPVISQMFSICGSQTECARKIFKMFNLNYLVLTRGADGHMIVCEDREIAGKSKAEKIVDTVGAGDAFTARFVSEILNGKTAEEAADAAAISAAKVCAKEL